MSVQVAVAPGTGQGGASSANGQMPTQEQWKAMSPAEQAQWQAWWASRQGSVAVAAGAAQPPTAYAQAMQASPQAAPMITLPGVTVANDRDFQSPMLSVCSKAKTGKSRTIITSLIDWPRPGMHPLVIAVDDLGPLSCIDAGYRPHRLRLRDEDYPGMSFDTRLRFSLSKLISNKAALHQQYGSVVVDCGSTLADKLHTAAKALPKNANNPRMDAPFFELGVWFRQTISMIRDLDLPNIWLSWSTEGFTSPADPQTKKPASVQMGGPDILGNKLRNYYSGLPAHNFYMEKRKVGIGGRDYDTGASADEHGFVRVLHSQPYDNVDAGGRLQRFLKPVMPAHMGYVLSCITGIGPYAQAGTR